MSKINKEASDGLTLSNTQGNQSALLPSSSATLTANTEPWSLDEEVSKLSFPIPTNPTSPIPFFHILERLKTTKREGWRRFGITSGESISDHMYRMSIITMLAPESLASTLNIPHCTKMALVHDMAESLVGDITPVDNVPTAEKHRREAESMEFLTGTLLGKSSRGYDQGQGLKEIWQEYEDSKTKEAIFVHDVDKMELLLQMMEYERRHKAQLDLGEFAGVVRRIQLEEVKVWCAEILKERAEFWKGMEHQPSRSDVLPKLLESLK